MYAKCTQNTKGLCRPIEEQIDGLKTIISEKHKKEKGPLRGLFQDLFCMNQKLFLNHQFLVENFTTNDELNIVHTGSQWLCECYNRAQ